LTEARITIIAALDRNNLIGRDNRMPWNIPEDLKYFRAKTLGNAVLMGKKTWLSLGGTLDQRVNFILTRDRDLQVPGAIVCHSPEECLARCSEEECFVIGGGQIFRLFLPLASKLCLTRIDAEFAGDTYFPEFNPSEWELVFYEAIVSSTGFPLAFTEYQRRDPAPGEPAQKKD
jgi:dihydrofolate reductase